MPIPLKSRPLWMRTSYAHMGEIDKARETISRLRAITSAVMPPIMYLRNPEHAETLLSGLRLAAGETA